MPSQHGVRPPGCRDGSWTSGCESATVADCFGTYSPPDDEWQVGSSITLEESDELQDESSIDADGEELSANPVWTGDGEDVLYTIDVEVSGTA